MWKERFLVAGGLAVLLGACAPRAERGRELTPTEARDESANAELGVVRALVAAFNQHEPERMAALVHEVRDGLVKRVWYYPAVEQSKASP
ncbi:hypothetical protein [Archangium sp.]|uniref:hypothetical protein n=1 Tax=Archangium sp. TaxID=1872627 RepID=UPI00286AF987|nr:hypothetical protein [Archangium sp.]